MRGYMKSLLAELFPGWLKQEVIQHRPNDPRRRAAIPQGPTQEKNPSFGKRSSYRAGASGSGRAARQSSARK